MGEDNVTDENDLQLARAIRTLPRDRQPERDLWVGIERQLADHPQRNGMRDQRWVPYGVATSLVFAVSALVLSVVQMSVPAPAVVGSGSAFEQMQVDHLRIRNPLVQKFVEVNEALDEQTLADLYRNIEIMEQARREIESQLREHPENRRLVEMLLRVHERELALLRQDFAGLGTTL